ncbi:hypothetical protein OIU77_004803 [Salix suchowensis]|uniref:Pentatricopeptide repeat-containing protein n=1 Tax=Salix suchowensis TaxID=1278906 RepID=A0ABQ9AVM4_9ROSI|nr:hypothetical protein OIU77_004803 [Salix suchowensis]
MEDKGIWCNKNAFKILVNAYAVSSNIEKMEKLLMKMERDSRINWNSEDSEQLIKDITMDDVPESLRGLEVYGALLNCYAHYKHLEEAEATMRKMREMGFVRNVLSYNVMLNLYYQMGKYEKLEVLMQEMEKWGICFSNITYKILLNAYVATSNIEEIKKKLMKMEADPLVSIDWYAYVVAANGYLKAGLIDKTLTMLWRSEQLISGKSARFACETLTSLYTAVGNKEQVYRVWNLYKTKGRSLNSSYHCMINSLLKLDGVDGAERI